MGEVNNKSVLITGAYGGMGAEVSRKLAELGYRVYAMDRTVGLPSENIIPVEADVTDPGSVEAAFRLVSDGCTELYAILHFAGIYMLNSLVEMDEREFSRIFDVNVKGAYLVNKSFLPLLRRGSRILITTSELAPLDPLPFTGIYAVTKAALDKYAYSLRMELQLLGISVSVLRAGAVSTGMLGVSTDALDRFCEKTALYTCNADRFRKIVNRVEARSVHPSVIAKRSAAIIAKRRPRFAYSINRNPMLLLLSALPKGVQCAVIGKILEK